MNKRDAGAHHKRRWPAIPDITTAPTHRRPDREERTAVSCPKCKACLYAWYPLHQAPKGQEGLRKSKQPMYLFCRSCNHFIDARVERLQANQEKEPECPTQQDIS